MEDKSEKERSPGRGRLKEYFASLSTLDLRSLALLRIGYGLVALFDLLNRARTFSMHYTDDGAMTREFVLETALTPGDWSLYLLHHSNLFAQSVYGIHIFAVLCLLVGWRTRAATVVCWLLFASLQDRNFAILNSGDNWLRLVLLWGIFLPWGHRWSIDSKSRSPELEAIPTTVTSVACFAYLFQEFSVYFFSGIFKTGDSWHKTGDAIYYAMHLNGWSGYLSPYLLYFPNALRQMSFAVVWIEILSPFLLFTPWFRGRVVSLAALAFMGFHLGLVPFMSLGIFPFVGIVSAVGLFPSWLWGIAPFRKLQALLDRLFSHCPSDAADVPVPTSFPCQSWLSRLFVTIAILAGFYWSVHSLSLSTAETRVKWAINAMTLDQNWSLFAPNPPSESGWMVVEGKLESGGTVDLIDGTRPATRVKPRWPFAKYCSQRERRFFVTVAQSGRDRLAMGYAKAALEDWSADHPGERLESVQLIWLSQLTLPNFEARSISERTIAEFVNSD